MLLIFQKQKNSIKQNSIGIYIKTLKHKYPKILALTVKASLSVNYRILNLTVSVWVSNGSLRGIRIRDTRR